MKYVAVRKLGTPRCTYEQLRIGRGVLPATLVTEAQREVDMEHRWGTRRTLSVGVKLYTRQSAPQFGRLLNASASGAYVATSDTPPIMSRVRIALGWDGLQRGGRHRIAAYVVRIDKRGIGIEWRDFAPPPVVALMQTLDLPRARTRRRVPPIGSVRPQPGQPQSIFAQLPNGG